MKNSRIATALALLCMALFLAALGLRLWASARATQLTGPDHIAAGVDRVYVHAQGELLVLSGAGALLARTATSALGLNEGPIDMRVRQDGRVLIALQRPARLLQCDPQDWQCQPLGQRLMSRLHAQYKVAVDEINGRLYVTDFDADALWMQPLTDAEPTLLIGAKVLQRPNDIAQDAPDRLWLADSGHHRLVAIQRDTGGAWRASESITARSPMLRYKRDWPMMLAAGADGNLWVVQPDGRGHGADLLVYHRSNGIEARIDLPEGAHPVDVAALGPAMLVTDRERFSVYRIDAASRQVHEFGDAAFRGILRAAAQRKAGYQRMFQLSLYGMIVFGVLMLLAAVFATPEGRRWTKPVVAAPLAPSQQPSPSIGGVHWLEPHAQTTRMLRWLMPLSYLSAVLMLGVLAGFYYYAIAGAGHDLPPEKLEKLMQSQAEFKKILLVAVFLFGGLPLILAQAMRNLKQQLGSDGHRLYIRLADGGQISLPADQLVYGDRLIAHQDRLFPTQTGNRQPLYAQGEVETWLAPLLARATRLGPWAMLRYQFTHREGTLMLTLTYSVILVILMIATGMLDKVLPVLGRL
jgi:hypothetical protein